MTTRNLLTCTALVVSTATAALGAAGITTTDLGIVLEAPASSSPRQLRAMTVETAAIWRPYGIRINWLSAREQPGPGPDEVQLVVRLPLSPPERTDGAPKRPLGAVLFVDGIPDRVMTIRRETVEAVIRDAGWNGRPLNQAPLDIQQDFSGRALGRVLAHELGHYLLAKRDHSPAGLMRPSFRASDLLNISRRGFQLRPGNLAALGPRLAQLMADTRPAPGPPRPFSASLCHDVALVCPTCPVCPAHPL